MLLAVAVALLAVALLPATAGRPYSMGAAFHDGSYAIGEEALLAFTLRDSLRPRDADGPVMVYVLSSTRIFIADSVGEGLYKVAFRVDERDAVDFGGLLVARGTATIRGVGVDAIAVAQVVRPLILAVHLSQRHPQPGETLEVLSQVTLDDRPADPQGLVVRVQQLAPGKIPATLPTARVSVGEYRATFQVPDDAHGAIFAVEVEAYVGPVDVFVVEAFSVPGWMAWVHLREAGDVGTTLDVWVADRAGRGAADITVSFDAREEAWTVAGLQRATDERGLASFYLPFHGLGPLSLRGWVRQGERRQPLEAYLGTPHAPPSGFHLLRQGDDALQGLVPAGAKVELAYRVLLDGQPLTSSRVLVSASTWSGEFHRQWYSTDRQGLLHFPLLPPQGELHLRFMVPRGSTSFQALDVLLGMDPGLRPAVDVPAPGGVATVRVSTDGETLKQALRPTARMVVLLGPATLVDRIWAWQPLTGFSGVEVLEVAADGTAIGTLVVPEFLPWREAYVLRALLQDQDEVLALRASGVVLLP